MKKIERQQALANSPAYQSVRNLSVWLDKYHIDGAIGLIPGGVGDVLMAFFSLAHLYFAAVKLKSVPLSLAVMNNCLRDVLMGMIPFFVGDVIDFFHKANLRNMQLIDGYVNNDTRVIHAIQRKAISMFFMLLLFVAAIALMFVLLWKLTQWLGSTLWV